jgi:elongation factor Tu
MKKILILILVIIVIVGGIFAYKYSQHKSGDLKKIETNELTSVLSTNNEDYFLLYIDEISKDNSNLILHGTISRGNIKVNDEISIVGLSKKEVITKVSKINNNNEEVKEAHEGDNIDLIIETEIPNDYIIQGQAVIKTGTTKPIYNINAKLNTISANSISELENKVNLFCINYDIDCSIKVISEENNEIKITLDIPIVVDDGIEITLKNNNKVLAKGITIDN